MSRAGRTALRRATVCAMPPLPPGRAVFAGVELAGVVESVDVRATPERLRSAGWWALVGDFEGEVRAWRFAEGRPAPESTAPAPPDRASFGHGLHARWHGPRPDVWTSSMGRREYKEAVGAVRARIREGDVYQANLCRVLAAPLGSPDDEPSAAALGDRLRAGNPAPFGGYVHVPAGEGDAPAWVVTASPELFLSLDDGVLTSAPIKGTARTVDGLSPKDEAENIMITDLVRNDLQHVCEPGTVEVTSLLAHERHPGLVHLVSTVRGRLAARLRDDPVAWAEILDATYPPGSVSGAPKSSALRIIDELEPTPRGPYCGLVGWLHVDDEGRQRARLAVGIRTFWWSPDHDGRGDARGTLRFGTGAGITWGSDPAAEWAETELKAARLIALASRAGETGPHV